MRHYAPHNTHFQTWASPAPAHTNVHRPPSSAAPSIRQRLSDFISSWRASSASAPAPKTSSLHSTDTIGSKNSGNDSSSNNDFFSANDENPLTPPPSPSTSTTSSLNVSNVLAQGGDLHVEPRLSALSRWLHLSTPFSSSERRALRTLMSGNTYPSTSKSSTNHKNHKNHCILCEDALDEEEERRRVDSVPNMKRGGGRRTGWFSTDYLILQIFAYISFWSLLLCASLISRIRRFRRTLYRRHLYHSRRLELIEKMNDATDYSEWYNAALILDLLDGNHSWMTMSNIGNNNDSNDVKAENLCEECDLFLNSSQLICKRKMEKKQIRNDVNAVFDVGMLTAKLRELSLLYREGDVRGLAFALRASLVRNFAGMCHPTLHIHSRVRTDQVVEDYVYVVSYLLSYVSQAEHHHSSLRVGGRGRCSRNNSVGRNEIVDDGENRGRQQQKVLSSTSVANGVLEKNNGKDFSHSLPLPSSKLTTVTVTESTVLTATTSSTTTSTNHNDNTNKSNSNTTSIPSMSRNYNVRSEYITSSLPQPSQLFSSVPSTSKTTDRSNNTKLGTHSKINHVSSSTSDTEVRIDDPRTLSIEDKLTFLNEARHAHGRTALMLSGGAVMGLHHFGIVKALLCEDLLPRVVCGTSAGALVASIVGTLNDAELNTLFSSNDEDNSKNDFINPLTGLPYVFQFFSEPVTWRGRLESFLRSGYLEDVSILQKTLRDNFGEDLTFQEAYKNTGRILNITVCPTRRSTDPPLLLNYLTAPHVLIWSAASASCALPVMFRPVELVAKSANGRLVPYHPDGCRWIDGSVSSDVPLARIGELFNVNHFIVSQTNPHVIPRSFPILNTRIAVLLKSEVQFRYWQLLQMGLVPKLVSAIFPHFMQPYAGDVTIMPHVRLTDLTVLMKNPTHELVVDFLNRGALQTYPYIDVVRLHCSIERVLDKCVEQVATTATTTGKEVHDRMNGLRGRGDNNGNDRMNGEGEVDDNGDSCEGDSNKDGKGDSERNSREWPSLSSGSFGLFGRVPSWLWLDARSILPKGGVSAVASRLTTGRDTKSGSLGSNEEAVMRDVDRRDNCEIVDSLNDSKKEVIGNADVLCSKGDVVQMADILDDNEVGRDDWENGKENGMKGSSHTGSNQEPPSGLGRNGSNSMVTEVFENLNGLVDVNITTRGNANGRHNGDDDNEDSESSSADSSSSDSGEGERVLC